MAKRNVTIDDLELARAYISNEGVGEFFGTSNAVAKLSEMTKSAYSFIRNAFSPIAIYFGNKEEKFLNTQTFASKCLYTDVNKVEIQMPEGFIGKPVEYTQHLIEGNLHSSKLILEVIKPFEVYIAKLIANPALLKSSMHTYTSDTKFIDNYRKVTQKHMSSKKQALFEFGKVYPNMKTLQEQHPYLVELYNQHSHTDVQAVKKAVEELYQNVNKVIEIIESNSNNIQPSKAVLNSISDILYELGVEVEFFAVVSHMTSQLVHASQVNDKTYAKYI